MIKRLNVKFDQLIKYPKLGEGSYSVVYKDVSEPRAIKCYKDFNYLTEEQLEVLFRNVERYHDLLLECDVIIPQELLVVDYNTSSKVNGYSTELINGFDLVRLRENGIHLDDSKFFSLAKTMYDNITTLSDNNISVMDLNEKNIMYDVENDRFVFIDMDFWRFDTSDFSLLDEYSNVSKLDKTFNKYRKRIQRMGR